MSRYFISLLVCCLIPSLLYAQKSLECEKLLNRKISFESIEATLAELPNFRYCGLDSFDVAFMSNPTIMAPFLIGPDAISTYGDYFKKVEFMLKMPEYLSMKQNALALVAVLDKYATTENWDKDTHPLLELGYSSEDLDGAKELMMNKQYERPTYRSVLIEYTSIRKAIEEKKEKHINDSVMNALAAIKTTFAAYCDIRLLKNTAYNTVAFSDYEAGMQCAQKMKRPVLLYFNGINCVNSRKMETTALADASLRAILEKNYVLIDLKCDDREPLPKSSAHFSKSLNRQVSTIGNANAELELVTYKIEYQPFFVVLNKVGKKVATTGYTCDPNELIALLVKGMAK